MDYLETFYLFKDEPFDLKESAYQDYLSDMLNYLISFVQRSQPLFEVDEFLQALDKEFDQKWAKGELPIQKLTLDAETKASNSTLFCKACKKSFSKDTVFKGHFNGKKHEKAVSQLQQTTKKGLEPIKHWVIAVYKISEICNRILQEHIASSKINIEKKQAKSWKELEDEMVEEEKVVEYSSEEEDTDEIKPSIPNYPLGWDGKPIPYWLYKLHGLGVEYKCEICGNTSYWGRKAYERHFQEWRHAYGMRCLNIPNTKHFQDITKINDAIMLWQKIRKDSTTEVWKPDAEEEYEDKDGNVFSKKTYEDLKRQGLI